ncbi:MAG: class I SAM-dependent methyltransferase [Bacteroidia bacterium]
MSAEDFRFKDYFSKQSNVSAQSRPSYPEELFAFLSGAAPAKDVAWDCATGNGQAATSLSRYFKQVIATDASQAQIANARQLPNIQYSVAPAEESGLPENSVSLVTVATALHWFDLDRFYAEVKRVLKPGGILAAWSYSGNSVNTDVDPHLNRLWHKILDGYWPAKSQIVWEKYRTIPFPFAETAHPEFQIKEQWNLKEQLNYLMSWSGTQRYLERNRKNPIEIIEDDLRKAWGNPEEKREVTWEIFMRMGKNIHNSKPARQ